VVVVFSLAEAKRSTKQQSQAIVTILMAIQAFGTAPQFLHRHTRTSPHFTDSYE
jgi:hypothetical protein